jgi:hypothetical protein
LREGINLATRPWQPRRSILLGWLVLVLALVGSVYHVSWSLGAREELDTLHDRVEADERKLEEIERQLDAGRRRLETADAKQVFSRLAALRAVGSLETMPATDVLSLLARVLPDKSRVIHLSLHATPPERSMRFEALTSDSSDASTILVRLTRSRVVRSAKVLEERPRKGGDFHLRIEAELAAPEAEIP